MVKHLTLLAVVLVIAQAALLLLAGALLTLAWNVIVPAIFAGPTISLAVGFALVLVFWVVGNIIRGK